MKTIFLLLAFICCNTGFGQTKEEWERTVEWDGVSHWSKYIRTQAAHMGPNALPIPQVGNGSLDDRNSLGVSGSLHFRKGDPTQNLTLYGNYSLVKDVVSIDLSYVPVEYFQTSDAVKKERNVFYANYYDKKAAGDVILNTNIRLLKKLDSTLQLTLRLGFRYPSSGDLGAARYTDAPGYYFDVSFGKPLSASLKLIGMAGFYCWQMTGDKFRQDDAFLFGAGMEWNKGGWKLQGSGAGYLGYILNSGDKPIVLRANIEKRNTRTGLIFRLQQGVHDYRYTTVEFGWRYFLASTKATR